MMIITKMKLERLAYDKGVASGDLGIKLGSRIMGARSNVRRGITALGKATYRKRTSPRMQFLESSNWSTARVSIKGGKG